MALVFSFQSTMAGSRVVVGAGGRTGRRGRPRRVQQPSVEAASNTGEEGSAAGGNLNNNERVQLHPLIQAAIVQAVATAVKNLNPEGSAGGRERTAEGAGGGGRKDDEGEREASSLVRSVKVDDRKRGRGGCNYKSFKGCDPPKLTGLGDTIATLQWITAMDKIIRISECRTDQAVGHATQSFGEEAMYWWESVEQRKSREEIKAMKWDDLKELVMKRFCADAEV
ncbi:uncharacterized protein LOC143626654 [Bidens hawaiensis]|uniref:uncharacterized protein LOC143626654 n=1 Tax=Bidens hawaiensis TaxID=980011 RepID=UPI004048EE94